jgi:hypothetical protein
MSLDAPEISQAVEFSDVQDHHFLKQTYKKINICITTFSSFKQKSFCEEGLH